MYNVMLKDARDENIVIIHDHKRHSPFDFFSLTEPIMVCLVILVINHLILPFFPDISMKRRLGIGALFMVLSILSATVLVISYKKLKHQFFWIFLPVGMFSVADTCIFVTGKKLLLVQLKVLLILLGLIAVFFSFNSQCIFNSPAVSTSCRSCPQGSMRLNSVTPEEDLGKKSKH